MGIKSLHKFLQKRVPDIYKPDTISAYKGQRIAVDTLAYLYKFKTSKRKRWITSFIAMLQMFNKYNIEGIFIYDTRAPEMKKDTIRERRAKRSVADKRIQDIREALEEYNESGNNPSPILIDIMNKKSNYVSKLLQPTNPQNFVIDSVVIQDEISRLEKQTIFVTREDITKTKELLDILGIAYFDADSEAETLCCYLCNYEDVVAVLSNDTDVLVYGTPVFITNLNMYTEACTQIRIQDILDGLELTQEEFKDFCIMCGTDYNKNIYQIGAVKAFKLIKKYRRLENIRDETNYDTSVLKFEAVREIFEKPSIAPGLSLNTRAVDRERLDDFLMRHNCALDLLENYHQIIN
jgi:5'-3' exonuclease